MNVYLFYVCVIRIPRNVTYYVPLQVCCAHASRVRSTVGFSRVAVFHFDMKKKSLVLAILGLFVGSTKG